jgi:anti-anti-sigma factor
MNCFSIDRSIQGVIKITLNESFDLNTITDFKSSIELHLSNEVSKVLIDADKCSFIDSSGVAALIYVKKICKTLGASFEVNSASSVFIKVLKLANLLEFFNIYEVKLPASSESPPNLITDSALKEIFNS